MINRFLWRVKNFIVHQLRFPRTGPLFTLARKIYKSVWSFNGRRIGKKITNTRNIFKANREIQSLTIDRKEGGVFSFTRGKFRWKDFKNSESLLGRIILSDKLDYEPEATELFSLILKQGDTVFDIGANFGWHSIHFAKLVLPAGRVYCFEPVPEAYDELLENVQLNFPDCSHIVAERIAIGEVTKETTIYVPKRLGSAFATLFPATIKKEFSEFVEKPIAMITLDDYIEKYSISKIDFIKCDAEGAELEIVRGAEKLLSDLSPILYLEINNEQGRDVFSNLREIGYSSFYFRNSKLRRLKNLEGELPDFNFLFCKKDSFERLRYLIED